MNQARVIVRSDTGHVRIDVRGDIDLSNADDVQAQLTAAIPNHATAVELDLHGVTYLDSAGLQVVYLLASRLQRLQITLRLVAPANSPARHALEVSGMGSIVPIEPSLPAGGEASHDGGRSAGPPRVW